MQIVSAGRLVQFMEDEGFSQARLARYAGVSRQFVHMLVSERKRTCSEPVALRIEEALKAPTGVLFTRRVSPVRRQTAAQRAARNAA